MSLIEREALEKIKYSYYHKETGTYRQVVFMGDVDKLPSIDTVPVRYGRWLDGRCTVCGWEEPDSVGYDGYEYTDWEETPYCPNCGAKMCKKSDCKTCENSYGVPPHLICDLG